jgi:hypothetical protein
MTTPYSYKTSSDYINELQFDYIETYSLQRGKEFNDELEISRTEYIRLQNQQDKRALNPIEENELFKLTQLGDTRYIVDASGKFHSSCKKTQTFRRTEPETERLITILKTEAINIPAWMCAPMYRDAVVFYDDSGSIVSTLNICFSCEYMAIKAFCEINADAKTYWLLKQFFIDLGHDIEDK